MKRKKVPPLGPKPRWIINEQRIVELKEVISNYMDANWPIHREWVLEYNELVSKLEEEK